MRLFYASDIHGSDVCFKKFVNAGTFYGADVSILGGDITGKLLVPIVRKSASWEADFQDRHYSFASADEVRHFAKVVRDCGSYYREFTEEEFRAAKASPSERHRFFLEAMNASVAGWMEFANTRLDGLGIECYVMLGNDDPPQVACQLARSLRVVNPDEKKVLLKGTHEMVSLGFSNKTPFDSPRELTEEELRRRISVLASAVEDMGRAVFNLHVPPRSSGLDMAPELEENLAIKSYGGQPKYVPVGSSAVRWAIEQYQPLLGLHGHVHESRGDIRMGRTFCVNPGSAYATGVVQGVVVDLDGPKVRSFQYVTG